MLQTLNLSSLEALMTKVLPQNVADSQAMHYDGNHLPAPLTESQYLARMKHIMSHNQLRTNFIGQGNFPLKILFLLFFNLFISKKYNQFQIHIIYENKILNMNTYIIFRILRNFNPPCDLTALNREP